MAGPFTRLIRRFDPGDSSESTTDQQLLERFLHDRDPTALAVLLTRHGPMVYGACRRVLGQSADTDDAFQATFLVLIRRAPSVGWHASVGAWLHTVAYRVARRARADAVRAAERAHRIAPREAPTAPDLDPAAAAAHGELCAVLDEELARLPAKYRLPLVLCYLEGRTNEEAARQLGWTKGTVSGRLARARILLRNRLSRRGVVSPAAVLGGALSELGSAAAVPAVLFESTLRAARPDVAGTTGAPGAASARTATLVEGVSRAMSFTRLKSATAVLLTFGLCAAGASLLAPLALVGAGPPTGSFSGRVLPAAGTTEDAPPGGRPVAPPPRAKVEGPPKAPLDELQGRWYSVSLERDGKPVARPEWMGHRQLRIDKDDYTWIDYDHITTPKIRVNADKNPKTFELFHRRTVAVGGAEKETEECILQGIYEVTGDTLRMASAGPGEGRPTGFKTAAGTGFVVITYKRGEPPDSPPRHRAPLAIVSGTATLYLGRDGLGGEPGEVVTKAIQDQAALAKFVACFPELGREMRGAEVPGLRASVVFTFTSRSGAPLTVYSSWGDWSEGNGRWQVRGNLVGLTGELFGAPALIDRGAIAGNWALVAAERGGKRTELPRVELVATPTALQWAGAGAAPEGWPEGAFVLAPATTPKGIDLTLKDGNGQPKTVRGIYAVDDTSLKICFGGSDRPRPTAFETAGPNEVLWTLRRKAAPPALGGLDAIRAQLRTGTPEEKARALTAIRELQALKMIPDVIEAVADPTPVPPRGAAEQGFIGQLAADVLCELARAVDGTDRTGRREYAFDRDRHLGGERLKDLGRLDEVRKNWAKWHQNRAPK